MSNITTGTPFDAVNETKAYLLKVSTFYDEIDFSEFKTACIQEGTDPGIAEEFVQKLKDKSIPAFEEGHKATIEFLDSPEFEKICEYFPDAPEQIKNAVEANAEAFLAIAPTFLSWLAQSVPFIPQTMEQIAPEWKPGAVSFKEVIPVYNRKENSCDTPPLLIMILKASSLLRPESKREIQEATTEAVIPAPTNTLALTHSKVSRNSAAIYNAGDEGLELNVGNDKNPVYTIAHIYFRAGNGIENRMEALPPEYMKIVRAFNSIIAQAAMDAAVEAGEGRECYRKYLRNQRVEITTTQLWHKIHPHSDYDPKAKDLRELDDQIDFMRCLLFEIICQAEYDQWNKLPRYEYTANVITASRTKITLPNGKESTVYTATAPSPDFQYSADKKQVYIVQDAIMIIYKRNKEGRIQMNPKSGAVVNIPVNMTTERDIVAERLYCSIRPILDGKTKSKKLSYETFFKGALLTYPTGTPKLWENMDSQERRRWRDFILNCLASWTQATKTVGETHHFEEYKNGREIKGIELKPGKWKPEHFLLSKPKPETSAAKPRKRAK